MSLYLEMLCECEYVYVYIYICVCMCVCVCAIITSACACVRMCVYVRSLLCAGFTVHWCPCFDPRRSDLERANCKRDGQASWAIGVCMCVCLSLCVYVTTCLRPAILLLNASHFVRSFFLLTLFTIRSFDYIRVFYLISLPWFVIGST